MAIACSPWTLKCKPCRAMIGHGVSSRLVLPEQAFRRHSRIAIRRPTRHSNLSASAGTTIVIA